jgi:hypothetical protein
MLFPSPHREVLFSTNHCALLQIFYQGISTAAYVLSILRRRNSITVANRKSIYICSLFQITSTTAPAGAFLMTLYMWCFILDYVMGEHLKLLKRKAGADEKCQALTNRSLGSVTTPCTCELYLALTIMTRLLCLVNWKGFQRKRSFLLSGYFHGNRLEDMRKITNVYHCISCFSPDLSRA